MARWYCQASLVLSQTITETIDRISHCFGIRIMGISSNQNRIRINYMLQQEMQLVMLDMANLV